MWKGLLAVDANIKVKISKDYIFAHDHAWKTGFNVNVNLSKA